MNLIKVGNFKVIVDYGHNVAAVKALSSVFAHLTSKRKISMASGTGNRLDEYIIEYGKTLGNIYDHIIITDTDPRDKPPGETAESRCFRWRTFERQQRFKISARCS